MFLSRWSWDDYMINIFYLDLSCSHLLLDDKFRIDFIWLSLIIEQSSISPTKFSPHRRLRRSPAMAPTQPSPKDVRPPAIAKRKKKIKRQEHYLFSALPRPRPSPADNSGVLAPPRLIPNPPLGGRPMSPVRGGLTCPVPDFSQADEQMILVRNIYPIIWSAPVFRHDHLPSGPLFLVMTVSDPFQMSS